MHCIKDTGGIMEKLYQYVKFSCEIITEKYAEINKNNLQNKTPKSKTKCCYLRKRNC